ncbi:MAG: hypothetical protein R2856_30895 [Caldilineaceae bacterium]
MRDIRAFVISDETICAIYRTSPHWITNTAHQRRATVCEARPNSTICVSAPPCTGLPASSPSTYWKTQSVGC